MRKYLITLLAIAITASTAFSADKEEIDPKKQLEILEKVRPALVTVEYYLRYDNGQPPSGADTMYFCHNCGRYHSKSVGSSLINAERPLELEGFLVAPKTVVSTDLALNPRFIDSIKIRYGDDVVKARILGYSVNNDAVYYEMEKPLKGTVPVKCDVSREGPYTAVTYTQLNGIWTIASEPLSKAISISKDNRRFSIAPANSLLLDKDGNAVTLSMNSELPMDGSWKKEPARWDKVSVEDFNTRLKGLEMFAASVLPRVTINFRSPKAKKNDTYGSHFYSSNNNKTATEVNAVGVCFDSKHVLVLANLKREETARLTRISVFDADGKAHSAKFIGTLKDFGALVAELEEPAKNMVKLATTDIMKIRRKLLMKAEIRAAGEQRIAHFGRGRITAVDQGHKNNLYPKMSGDKKGIFLFNDNRELLVLPINVRQKVSLNSGSYWSSGDQTPTLASIIKPLLDDLENSVDPSNVPVGEDEEDRIAWMGVVLQKLNRELARANKVSEQTQDGNNGALVTYVYPDSPSDKAGIKQGMILLRLVVEGEPKPIDVKVASEGYGRSFRWENLERMAVESFDRIPPPWPAAENAFSKILTDIGIGKKYVAELYHDGKDIRKEFTVEECPEHYGSAKKHKSKRLGATVRNLTFEVRRHLQKKADDPGVIISKVETGSKAAVAGIRPFELITQVNGKPVRNIDEFEKAVIGDELDISIDRMSVSRQVRIQLTKEEKNK